MREINMRVWNIRTKEISYDSVDLIQAFIFQSLNYYKMLGTGLKDATGKEIFEGDILTNTITPKEDEEPTISVVKWINTPYTACFNFNIAPPCHLAFVIGNIHENPDLLKCE